MNPQTAEEINKLDLQNQIDTRTALNTQLNPYDQLRNQRRINSITSSTGITPTNAPISSANLGQTNPIILPETTPSTKATGIIAGVNNATQNDLTQQAVANAKATAEAAGVGEAQKQKKTALEAIKGLFGKETTLMQESQTSPEALQIQTENTTLTDLNNKITDENAKLKAERDAITARGDISKSAQAGLITNLEDVYGRRLADLSTRQANAIGNITRLKSSLKDSLDMKLAPIEKEIQYYKDFEINNLDELSKTEKETLTNIINERTRLQTQITESHKILETALKSALDNGIKIPDDVVAQMQEKPEDSYSILASNGINLQDPLERQLKQAQIASANRANLPSVPTDANGVALTDSGKPMNDAQATSYGYAQRLVEANGIVNSIGNQFAGASSYVGQLLPNILKSSDRQLFEQAQRNFINSVLRRESGAVISEDEFKNARQQYFPQPGDSQPVLAQKKQNRETVIQNFYRQAGVLGQVQQQVQGEQKQPTDDDPIAIL